METMDKLMMMYSDLVQPVGEGILNWARPEGRPIGPTEGYPLASWEAASGIALLYLAFVFFGSKIMSIKQKPFKEELYPYKFVYNVVQVMLCSYMCIEAGLQAYKNGYTLTPCVPFNVSNPPMGDVLYIFYLSKILDFLDTVFIILSQKWDQLSFLHVYHHTSIFLFYWLNLNVGYDGDVYLTIVLNGFIHTIMYTYYFVSMHARDIWWKKSLTMCQLIQFFCMNAQAAYLLYYQCTEFPRNIVLAYMYYIFTMIALFGSFYINSYSKRKSKKQ